MYEVSEELKRYVDDQFNDLNEYATCDCSYADIAEGESVKKVNVVKFVNGLFVGQGEEWTPTESVGEAIGLTRGLIDRIKMEYKHIIVRIKPQLEKGPDGFYLYFRAAISN